MIPEVKFFAEHGLQQLTKAHESDAGFDICTDEDVLLPPLSNMLVATGLHVAIPEGYVGVLKPRSGLSSKTGSWLSAGVIDAGYRGEVKVLLCSGADGLCLMRGDRIAQLLVLPCAACVTQVGSLAELGTSTRGASGFGSSGR